MNRRRPHPGGGNKSRSVAASRSSSGYVVRASELGSYEYCHRSWWLREIAGVAPSAEAQARLDRGKQRHATHGRAVAFAPLLLRGGFILLALATLLLIISLILAPG